MKKRNICFVTGSRAEYNLLYFLMKYIKNDKKLNLQLIVQAHIYLLNLEILLKKLKEMVFI